MWLWLFICCEVAAFGVVRSVLVGWVCSGAWCGFQFWVTAMCCFVLCFVEWFGWMWVLWDIVFCWCLDWFASCGFGLFGLACDCLAVMVVVL